MLVLDWSKTSKLTISESKTEGVYLSIKRKGNNANPVIENVNESESESENSDSDIDQENPETEETVEETAEVEEIEIVEVGNLENVKNVSSKGSGTPRKRMSSKISKPKPEKRNPVIMLGGKSIKIKKQVKYLGIIIEKGFKFHEHCKYLRSKVTPLFQRLRKLAKNT